MLSPFKLTIAKREANIFDSSLKRIKPRTVFEVIRYLHVQSNADRDDLGLPVLMQVEDYLAPVRNKVGSIYTINLHNQTT